MPMPVAKGFAVFVDDEIDVNTVSTTVRAARVNGLVTRYRVLVKASWPDEHIDNAWHRATKEDEQFVVVGPVDISAGEM